MESDNFVTQIHDIIQNFYDHVLDVSGKEKAEECRMLLIIFVSIQFASMYVKWLLSDDGKSYIKMLISNYHGGSGNG